MRSLKLKNSLLLCFLILLLISCKAKADEFKSKQDEHYGKLLQIKEENSTEKLDSILMAEKIDQNVLVKFGLQLVADNNVELFKCLLNHGVNPNLTYDFKNGETEIKSCSFIFLAVFLKHMEITKALLHNNINVSVKSSFQNGSFSFEQISPLAIAVIVNWEAGVELLLKNNASPNSDITIINKGYNSTIKKTPFEIAVELKNINIQEMLLKGTVSSDYRMNTDYFKTQFRLDLNAHVFSYYDFEKMFLAKQEDRIIRISADTLASFYSQSQNNTLLEQRIVDENKNRLILVFGRVSNIRRSILSEYIVTLETKIPFGSIKVVFPEDISSAVKNKLSLIRVGDNFESLAMLRSPDCYYVDVPVWKQGGFYCTEP